MYATGASLELGGTASMLRCIDAFFDLNDLNNGWVEILFRNFKKSPANRDHVQIHKYIRTF
jgi:hypothetical protein